MRNKITVKEVSDKNIVNEVRNKITVKEIVMRISERDEEQDYSERGQ